MHVYKLCDATPYLAKLQQGRLRQLLLLRGEKSWCYAQAKALLSELGAGSVRVLSHEKTLTGSDFPFHVHQILGQEHPHALYDCFSGLYPDKLAALSGTVKAGGLLMVLMPKNAQEFADPALQSVISFGQTPPVPSLFWQWLTQQINELENTFAAPLQLVENCGWQIPNLPPYAQISGKSNGEKKRDANAVSQSQAVERIIKTATGRANRPLLISADRGRGKSAALGMGAGQLSNKKVIFCATQRSAMNSAFKHLAQSLNLSDVEAKNSLAHVTFMPPDALLESPPQADVVMVDEAAAIPVPVLTRILSHYSRVIFASTLIGYEGNGRGYTLRFKRFLTEHYPNFTEITLSEPYRFANNDLLESSINQLLALDSHYHALEEKSPAALEFTRLDKPALLGKPQTLKHIFALLVLAHYQTSINDFRQLLDAPNQHVFVAMQNQQIIAVALIAIEGDIPREVIRDILATKRRVQGHLLAQSLATLADEAHFLTQQCARVVRIAVHPSWQGQGVGSALVTQVQNWLKTQPQVTTFGTSFGAEDTLLAFWQKQGFNTVKLGVKKDKVSGEHSALLAKAIQPSSAVHLHMLQQQFEQNLPVLLSGYFNVLPTCLVVALLQEVKQAKPSQADRRTIVRFVAQQVPFAEALPALWRSVYCQGTKLAQFDKTTQAAVVKCVLQLQPIKNMADFCPPLSQKETLNTLRAGVKEIFHGE